ncbi:hypothetical protein [Caulobacter sp. LARHSG274]
MSRFSPAWWTGNYEVAHEALYILESVEAAPGEEVDRVASAAETALASAGLEDWRRELLKDLIECYGPLKSAAG